jgi:hypothetical protein
VKVVIAMVLMVRAHTTLAHSHTTTCSLGANQVETGCKSALNCPTTQLLPRNMSRSRHPVRTRAHTKQQRKRARDPSIHGHHSTPASSLQRHERLNGRQELAMTEDTALQGESTKKHACVCVH